MGHCVVYSISSNATSPDNVERLILYINVISALTRESLGLESIPVDQDLHLTPEFASAAQRNYDSDVGLVSNAR